MTVTFMAICMRYGKQAAFIRYAELVPILLLAEDNRLQHEVARLQRKQAISLTHGPFEAVCAACTMCVSRLAHSVGSGCLRLSIRAVSPVLFSTAFGAVAMPIFGLSPSMCAVLPM